LLCGRWSRAGAVHCDVRTCLGKCDGDGSAQSAG
jgi:hypothetical protein